jgi:hypothetical protein
MEKELEVGISQLSPTDSDNSIDLHMVDWDGPDDSKNPRNWSVWKRGMIIGVVMSIVFST